MSMSKLDANQVIKSVYDEATGSLKTIPGEATSFEIELSAADGDSTQVQSMASGQVVLSAAVAAGANFNSTVMDITNYKTVVVVATWTGFNAADATLQLQGSIDSVTWVNEGSAVTLATASGASAFKVTDIAYPNIRLVFAHGTNTTGTISALGHAKG